MAFPIIPRRRSAATGNPTSLNLGELAVNTLTGELFLGADGGVTLLNGPVAAGTTVTEHTGDGTTVAFTFGGYNGTADGGYIVSVGGIDQPPSKYAVTSTAGGTITFVEAPTAGELISIRAIVAGSGGGGSGDATSLQGRSIATTAPTNGQVLAWNATTSKWEPQGGGGSVTFNTEGIYYFQVPSTARWARLQATGGDGANGTDGTDGSVAYFDLDGIFVQSENGSNGVDGSAGKSVKVAETTVASGGAGGGKGWGGGRGGNSIDIYNSQAESGANGLGPEGGAGGAGQPTGDAGGGIGPDGANGGNGQGAGGGAGGLSDFSGGGHGGAGGFGGKANANTGASGGGGGGGGFNGVGNATKVACTGLPGEGGVAGTGLAGQTVDQPFNLTPYAGGQLVIEITEGAGNASITISW
jgi:hypothetical protein